jgi:hypothetical protein
MNDNEDKPTSEADEMITMGVRVPKTLYKTVKGKAGPVKISDILRGLLQGWVDDKVEMVWEDGKFKIKDKKE